MGLPLKTGFPPDITVSGDYIIRFRAIDPTTGADVAGVNISNASIFSDLGEQFVLADALPPVTLLPDEFQLTGTQVRHQ